ncbi:ankyrin repeat and SAM domain-containing protein 6 isoform X1 [Cajanus cajan]|uniref:ankyrin repeat and SAM domain-containing protein 6 isoform X1 n=1 Tax=Cajanus cajan TaxID=3821 RepID=UPI00098D899E|nr:ankyrin repeat and SAM domain-containing protein 6 isoform X1 [Cajanus cajan]
MYADRVESGGRRSVKERLNGNVVSSSTRQHQRQVTGKRSRQDDKWEHDLFHDDEPRITNRKVSAQDLRLKLRRKGLQPAAQSGKSSAPNTWDLRERLSGTMKPQPTNSDPPKSKVVKPSSKNVSVEAPEVQLKRPADPAPKRSRKVGNSVDDFLQSLGLEKYLITFQAEEVDMTALNHMTDEDLKAMGIPMGPRKKILLALESKSNI